MNQDSLRALQYRMLNLLLLNLLIAVIVPTFFAPLAHSIGYAAVFAGGAGVLAIIDRRYARYLFWSLRFVLYLIWQIIVSNLSLAWLVLQPKPKLDPGIIAIPLTINTGIEILALASAITLTPGTLSIDLGRDAEGQRVLYVHALRVGDPAQFRTSIKQGFEQMILQISRGVAQ